MSSFLQMGYAVTQLGEALRYEAEESRVRFSLGSFGFFLSTMALGSTQPLKRWVEGIFPGGKGGRFAGLITLPRSCANCHEILEASTSWKPQGLSRTVQGQLYLCLSSYVAFLCHLSEEGMGRSDQELFWGISCHYYNVSRKYQTKHVASTGKACGLYSGDTYFECRPSNRLSLLTFRGFPWSLEQDHGIRT